MDLRIKQQERLRDELRIKIKANDLKLQMKPYSRESQARQHLDEMRQTSERLSAELVGMQATKRGYVEQERDVRVKTEKYIALGKRYGLAFDDPQQIKS